MSIPLIQTYRIGRYVLDLKRAEYCAILDDGGGIATLLDHLR